MQHTRQQIIDYLQSNRNATSTELSRVLSVTPADVRYHLKKLEDARLVEEVGFESLRGRGRPIKIYSLRENALKHNLSGLTSALLQALPPDINESKAAINRVAKNLLGDYKTASSRHSQLKQTVEKLNELKYQATWEASPNGPRIIFRNCPYAMILAKHPEICQIDSALLTTMLDRPIIQIAKLERSPDGSPHCAFIHQNKE